MSTDPLQSSPPDELQTCPVGVQNSVLLKNNMGLTVPADKGAVKRM
jgi:hypothetical protein